MIQKHTESLHEELTLITLPGIVRSSLKQQIWRIQEMKATKRFAIGKPKTMLPPPDDQPTFPCPTVTYVSRLGLSCSATSGNIPGQMTVWSSSPTETRLEGKFLQQPQPYRCRPNHGWGDLNVMMSDSRVSEVSVIWRLSHQATKQQTIGDWYIRLTLVLRSVYGSVISL